MKRLSRPTVFLSKDSANRLSATMGYFCVAFIISIIFLCYILVFKHLIFYIQHFDTVGCPSSVKTINNQSPKAVLGDLLINFKKLKRQKTKR